MRCIVFLLLLAKLAHSTFTNPELVNYLSFNVSDSTELGLAMVIDETGTSLYAFIYDESYNLALLFIKLDPQYGTLLEDSAVTVPLGNVDDTVNVMMLSPMPNKIAVFMSSDLWCREDGLTGAAGDGEDTNSTFMLYNANGELEQLMYISDTCRLMTRPSQTPDSALYNTIFLSSTNVTDVIVLTWNGSQYEQHYHSFLPFATYIVVENFVYGVLFSNRSILCKYDIQDVFVGNAVNISCNMAPEYIDDQDEQYLIVSPAQNRLIWMGGDFPGFIAIYEIPLFEQEGVIPLFHGVGEIEFSVASMLSDYGELLVMYFIIEANEASNKAVEYIFQDISELPLAPSIYPNLYPSFLTTTPWGTFPLMDKSAVSTRGARFTYTLFLLPEANKFYVIAYETAPVLSPDAVATFTYGYINVLGDFNRGLIWAIAPQNSGYIIRAVEIGASFTTLNTTGDFSPNCTGRFKFWYFNNNSQYIVFVSDQQTCVYDLHQWPQRVVSVATIPVSANSREVTQQIIWIGGEAVKISILDMWNQGINNICIMGNMSCQVIITPDGDMEDGELEMGIAVRGESEIVVVSRSSQYGVSTTSLLIFPVESSTSLGNATEITLVEKCLFISSKIFSDNQIWFMCVQENTQYVIYQYDYVQQTLGCSLLTNVYYRTNIHFTLRDDGQYLSVATNAETRVYDISGCFQNSTTLSLPFPVLRSVYSPQVTYSTTFLFQANGVDLQIGLGVGGLDIIADCGSGMRPNKDKFCSKCPPGTSGILCQACTGGYICDGYGTITPNQACPPGYFCLSGTNSSIINETGGPSLCPAGTYCPFGIALENVNLEAVNSPRWCPQGYYCPVGSSKPDAFTCSQYSNTKGVGARSIEDCVCNDGYWGQAGNCMQCPVGCNCYENVTVGCYIDVTSDTYLVTLCPPYNIMASTACNPSSLGWDGTGDFPCAEGYTGRLCSKCLPNYYKEGRECVKCHDDLKWKLPIAYAAVCVLMTLYVWFKFTGSSAVILILAFHFQTLEALMNGSNQWHTFSSNIFGWASSSSSFSLKAVECILPWWNVEVKLAYYLLALPVVYVFFAGCAAFISILVNKRSADPQPTSQYKLKAAKMVVYLYNFNYFTVVMLLLSFLAAENGYLNQRPWMKFNTTLAIVAIVGLVVEGILVPLGIAATIWKHHSLAENGWVKSVFGGLYCVFVPSKYYWELVITIRRIAVACIITFSPYNSPMLMIGMITLVLLYLIVQIKVNPYIREMDNILETASHFILVCTLTISLIVGYPTMHAYATGLVYTVAVMNTMFLCVGVLYAIYSFRERIGGIFGFIKGRVESITCCKRTSKEQKPLISPVEPDW